MFRFTLGALFVLAVFPSLVFAQADETRCRSAESIYQSPANGRGTVTGFLGDRVIIKNRNGTVVSSLTIQEWTELIWIHWQYPLYDEIVHHSGGQVSVRINYWALTHFFPLVPGGSVEIRRNGSLIDRDPLY